jgi:hypothetical protein
LPTKDWAAQTNGGVCSDGSGAAGVGSGQSCCGTLLSRPENGVGPLRGGEGPGLEAAADAAPEPEPEPAPEPAPAEHPWDASSSYITLKAACRARGLAAAGNAATLARRLARHDGGG